MPQTLGRLIDRVIAWVDRLIGPAPKLIPIPVRQEAGRKPQRPDRA